MPALLSSRLSVPALLSLPVPTLLSPPIPTLSSPPISASLSSPVSASSSRLVLALLSRSMLGPTPTYFISSVFRTFKQALSDQLLHHHSTSSAELLCPFPNFDPLSEKKKRKWPFNIAFINSHSLAGNHIANKVDLSFKEYNCPTPVKLNQL